MKSRERKPEVDRPRPETAVEDSWLRHLPLLAFLAAVAVSLPALAGGFVWDDKWLVLQSPLRTQPGLLARMLLGGHGWGTMVNPEEGSGYFRPLETLLHGALLLLFGAHPLPFRIFSSVLHAGTAWLLGILLRRQDPRAAWGSVLFAVHPVLADAFGWISAAPDMMAAASLLGMLALLERPRPRALAVAGLWLVALLSKESAVVGILWALLLFLYRRRAAPPSMARLAVVLGLATAAYLALRVAGIGFNRPVGEYPPGVAAGGLVLTGRLLLIDLWRLLVPVRLTLSPPPWVVAGGGAWSGVLGLLLGFALFAGSLWLLARRDDAGYAAGVRGRVLRSLALGLLLCLTALLPVLQILRTNDIFGGRFLYLPAAGLCLGLGLAAGVLLEPASRGIARKRSRLSRGAWLALLLLPAALALRSGLRAAEWRDEQRLFGGEYTREPLGIRSAPNWAGYLLSLGRIDEARPVVEDLARRFPDHPSIRSLRALLWLNEGRVAEAEAAYRELAQSWKRTPTLLANLASCQMRMGRLEEGLATLDEATRHLTPTPGMRNNRGLALKMLGRTEEARREFERAIAMDPSYEPARVNLIGLLVLDRPDPAAARRQAEAFLRLFPQSPRAATVGALMDSLRWRDGR